jgi:hypothetical protein
MYAARVCEHCRRPLPLSKLTGRPSRFCPGSKCRMAALRAREAGRFVTKLGAPTTTPYPASQPRDETRPRPPLEARRTSKSASSPSRTETGRDSAGHLKMHPPI